MTNGTYQKTNSIQEKTSTVFISNYSLLHSETSDTLIKKIRGLNIEMEVVSINLDDSFFPNLEDFLLYLEKHKPQVVVLFNSKNKFNSRKTHKFLECFFDILLQYGIPTATCYLNPDIPHDQLTSRTKSDFQKARVITREGVNLKIKNGKELYQYIFGKLKLMELTQQSINAENGFISHNQITTPPAGNKSKLYEEFQLLEQRHCCILKRLNFSLYLTSFEGLRHIPFELGRLREETFRAVGEGTGNTVDLDFYDSHYKHLILYDHERKCLAGSYRLGLGESIYRDYGVFGFYLHSLYEIDPKAGEILSHSVELGRSFIVSEYQKKRLPLLLLWNGLMQFLNENKQYKYLIGTVSISKIYNEFSRSIIVNYLRRNHFCEESSKLFHPRNTFEDTAPSEIVNNLVYSFDAQLINLDDFISELEPEGHRIPVLIRQYLKQNATFMGFNKDPNFSDCLDGLIKLNVDQIPDKTLKMFQQNLTVNL